MHPLAPDLSLLTEEELHKKHGELQTRIMFAYRMGHGDMVGQLQLLIGDYEMEIQRRNQKIMDQLQKNNKNFGNIINISQ
jgi:hypothetical protein